MSSAPAPTPGGEGTPQPAAAEGPAGGSAPGTAVDGGGEATGQSGIEIPGLGEMEVTEEGNLKPKGKPAKKAAGPKLPGVMEDGPELATERPRDEHGRFVARPDVATEPPPKDQVPDAGQEPAPEPPADPNAPAKFKFAGEEFESQEAAEQNFKSLRGQFKPLSDTAHKAAASATAWKSEAEKYAGQRDALYAELQAVKATQSQPASTPAEPAEPATPAPDSIDWELYAEISKQYTAAGTPHLAQKWLMEQVEAIQSKREASLKEQFEKPQREAAAHRQRVAATEKLFGSLAEYNNSDGTPAYPELRDKDQAYAVGRFWSQMGLPTEYATTPQGAIAAIAMYRMAVAADASATQAAVGSQGSPAPQPPAPESAAGAAAAELAGGRPTPNVSPSDSSVSPEAARIIAGLRDTQLTRPGLGFEP